MQNHRFRVFWESTAPSQLSTPAGVIPVTCISFTVLNRASEQRCFPFLTTCSSPLIKCDWYLLQTRRTGTRDAAGRPCRIAAGVKSRSVLGTDPY